jgi:hypothetical protein
MHGTLPQLGLSTPTVLKRNWQKSKLRYMDMGFEGKPSRFAHLEKHIGGVALAALEKEYPGHAWNAKVNCEGGILEVKLISFSDWSEVVHIRGRSEDEIRADVVDAGGNWLERYGFPRRGLDVDDYKKQMSIWLPTFSRQHKPPD